MTPNRSHRNTCDLQELWRRRESNPRYGATEVSTDDSAQPCGFAEGRGHSLDASWTLAPDTIGEVIDAAGFWRCQCGAPLTEQEAELLAEPECDEQYRWLHRDPPMIGIGNMGGGHGV